MLRYLRVTDLAVVRDVSFELDSGFVVLTGETGAGKSIMVDALTLLLGARASSELVRTGSDHAAVEGIFRVDHNPAALAVLAELEIEIEDGELVLRREVSAKGRGRAYVNGALHPVATLRRLGWTLADVHAQHEHIRLLDPTTHLELLDSFAKVGPLRVRLAEAFQKARAVELRLTEMTDNRAERERRRDFLRFETDEIAASKIEVGEDEDLAREHTTLANAERLCGLAESGYQGLYASDRSVLARLAELERELVDLAELDITMGSMPKEVASARATLEEVALTLRDYARDRSANPRRLLRVEERLAVLNRLKGKYGAELTDVVAFFERAKSELQGLIGTDEERGTLETELAESYAEYTRLAIQLSGKRRTAASRLSKRVEGELAELAMEKARFYFAVESEPREGSPIVVDGQPLAYGASGTDRVEMMVSTNVGEEPRPMARVASGGELSRLLLALRGAAGHHGSTRVEVFHGLEAGLAARVAVFDEVDAGIGGRVAHVLAKKLHSLSERGQVLCVTHLPPVAAAATHHFRVTKDERAGRTEVVVERVSGKQRKAEIARMIGGDSISAAVTKHAGELLAKFVTADST